MTLRWSLFCWLALAPVLAVGQSPRRGPSPVQQSAHRVARAEQPYKVELVPAGTPQQGERLTLEQAQGIALANHPALAFAAARVAAARGAWVQAGLGRNPEIGYLATEIGDDRRAGQQGGFVSQEFVTGGKLRLNREVAARDIALAEQFFAAQRLRVLTDVAVAYHNAAVSHAWASKAEQLIRDAEELVRVAGIRVKTKVEGKRADLLQAQVELDQERNELLRAQRQRNAAWRILWTVLGTPNMPQPTLVANLPEESAYFISGKGSSGGDAGQPRREEEWDGERQEKLDRLVSQSPEMAAAVMRAERARWALARAQREPMPNVTLEGSVQHDYSTRDTIAGVQASIPVPLFNRNQGAIMAAQSELRAAERNLERVALALQKRLDTEFPAYTTAFDELRRLGAPVLMGPEEKQKWDRMRKEKKEVVVRNTILARSHAAAEDLVKLYAQTEEGVLPLEVLTALRTRFDAHRRYYNAVQELRGAEARIEGLLLSGSLEDLSP